MRATKTIHIFAVGFCLSIGTFSIAQQDADMDGFPVPIDCNDNDPNINPAAPEIMGDGIDNNCDGIIDSTTVVVTPGGGNTGYVDADNDGFPDFIDCDDNNANINPGMPEIMGDGIDNNCDGLIDSVYTGGGGNTGWIDADNDGFFDFEDCDDNNPNVNPAMPEIPGNGIDDNCDGFIDSTFTWTGGGNGTGVDADNDGFPDFIDCDDNNAAINPGMPEIMGDGIDNNCDGLIDSVYTGGGGNTGWIDADNDGFFDFEDCDDNNPNVNPAMPEIPGNGIDDNCDGFIDSTFTWTGGGNGTGVDADNDGFPDFIDCDDNNANINPGMPEIIGDGIDNNCDGLIDSVYTGGGNTGFVDADGDGWFDFEDCDDNDPNVNPAAMEIIGDGIDNNCDGLVDSTYWGGGNPGYVDADGDGFPSFIDCDDTDSTINPGATEIMGDGIDNDCDGLVDMPSQWGGNNPIILVDADGDGWPAIIDCDDNDPNVNPGMPEIPGDGIDNNCNGVVDLNIAINNNPQSNDPSSSNSVKVSNELISSVGPNPVSSLLKVTLQPDTEATVQVLDMAGKVMNVSMISDANTLDIDVSNLPAGIYLLEVTSQQTRVVERIVKR
jgi:hypothetical protein